VARATNRGGRDEPIDRPGISVFTPAFGADRYDLVIDRDGDL